MRLTTKKKQKQHQNKSLNVYKSHAFCFSKTGGLTFRWHSSDIIGRTLILKGGKVLMRAIAYHIKDLVTAPKTTIK